MAGDRAEGSAGHHRGWPELSASLRQPATRTHDKLRLPLRRQQDNLAMAPPAQHLRQLLAHLSWRPCTLSPSGTTAPSATVMTHERELWGEYLLELTESSPTHLQLQASTRCHSESPGTAADDLAALLFEINWRVRGERGLLLLRMPAHCSDELLEREFVMLCSMVGRPTRQSADLLETVGKVEVPQDSRILNHPNTRRRGYRNSLPQRVHVDASIPARRGHGETDVLAMLCIRPAANGGVQS
eukprot:SAG31_NODE_6016_length_2213_cov_5.098392_2_plen_243_part_00